MSSEDFWKWLDKQVDLAYTKASRGEYQQAILIELETIREILVLYAKSKFKCRSCFGFIEFFQNWFKKTLHNSK